MKRRPTLRQLQYLCAVADAKHFGKAAQDCFVSQSTLSAGIHELEECLGCKLLERSSKKVFLTPRGDEVLQRALSVLADVDDLVSAAVEQRPPLSGKLHLGVIPTIAPFLLPRLLPALNEAYPQLQLFIREDLSGNLAALLKQGELDVLLLALPYAMEGVESELLFDDSFSLALFPGHPLAAKKRLRLQDLEGQDLLLLEDGHCLRDHALQACHLRASQVGQPYQATSLHTLVQMVANRIGITLLPRMAINSGIVAGTGIELQDFPGEEMSRGVGLAWRNNSPMIEEFRIFGEFIKNGVV